MANKYLIGNNSSFSDATRWSLASGGANDTGVPVAGDVAIVDANATGAVVMDLTAAFSITTVVGFVGTITLANAWQNLTSDMTHAANAVMSDAGFAITVRDWVQTGSAKMTKTSSSGLFYAARNFLNSSSPSGNSWANDIKVGTSGMNSNIRSDNNGNRVDFMRVAGAIYTLTGRLYFDVVFNQGFSNIIKDNGSTQQWVSPTFQNAAALNECIFQLTARNRINMAPTSLPTGVFDLGGVEIGIGSGTRTISATSVYNNVGTIAVWVTNSTSLLNVNGVLSCDALQIGSSGSATRGGRVAGTGSITCKSLSAYNNLHNGTVEAELVLTNLSAFTCTGNFTVQANATVTATASVINLYVNGNVSIDASAICAWGLTKLITKGTYTNVTSSNSPYNLEFDTSLSTAKLLTITRLSGKLSFTGTGTFDWNSQTIRIDNFGAQLTGIDLVTLLNTGNAGDLVSNISGGSTFTIPPQLYAGINWTFVRSGTQADVTVLGNVTFNIITVPSLITLHHNGYTITTTNRMENAGSSSLSSIMLEGGTLVSPNYQHEGALAELIGQGSMVLSNDLRHTFGVLDLTDIVISIAVDHEQSAGTTLNMNNGRVTTLGNFAPLGTVNIGAGYYGTSGNYDLSGASAASFGAGSQINLFGSAVQSLRFGGFGGPDLITIKKSGGQVLPVDDIDIDTILDFDPSYGNNTWTWDIAVAYSIKRIDCNVITGNVITMNTNSAGVQSNVTVFDGAGVIRGMDLIDSHFKTVIVDFDNNTCQDLGNNFLNGSEGARFTDQGILLAGRNQLGIGQLGLRPGLKSQPLIKGP